MMLRTVGLAAAVSLLAVPARADEELRFGPAPEWVEAQPQISGSLEENSLPARVLLLDNQVRFEDGQQSVYSAVAIKFQTPQGLSGGNLTFDWRPETQDITVHKVVLRRGDETIDVLETGQTFSILRREQNLEQAMLDGTLTASLFPEDLQVGDVLEFASTVVTRDPVFAGHGEIAVGPLNAPIDRANIRFQWPTSKKMQLAKTADLPDWTRARQGGFETASLTLENIEPLPLPRLAPLRYAMVRFIEASDFASWGEVAALEEPLYAKAARVPAQGPLRNEVERIREASQDPVARAEAALKLVQGRIRYVALQMGQGGLVPADAETTWSRRYGDCKAKTALLLAILGELGIEAHGVAVHTEIGDLVAGRLPSIGAFNHILVRARIDGKDYWLDGTRTGDSSLAKLQVPSFGWGLPIVPGAELVRIVPAPLEEPLSDLVIHMDAREGVRGPVPTRIELTLRGDAAIATDQVLANFVGEARDRALREFWRQRFNFVQPDKVAFTYDNAAQELTTVLEGIATLKWDGVWYETDETGLGFRADFSREAGPASDAPFSVTHPFYRRTRQTIMLPPGFSAPTGKDLNVDETVAGIEYRRTTRFADDTLFVEASERSIADEFPAAEAPAFEKRLRELAGNDVYLRLPDARNLTPPDAAAFLEEEPDSAGGYVDQGVMLMDAGQNEEAVAKFVRATELEPDDVWAWANLGLTYANLGKFQEAEEALDRATELDPDNWVIYNGRGLLAEEKRDWPAAIAAFSKTIELQPTNSFARGRRASLHMGMGDTEHALRDAEEALKLWPQYLQMNTLRAFAFARLGKTDEAEAELDAMLRNHPENAYALGVASEMYIKLGLKDKAREIVDRVESDGTFNPVVLYSRSMLRDPADTEGKLADLDEVIRQAPNYVDALTERASLRSRADAVDDALADVARAIELRPERHDLYLLQANIARSDGRTETALAAAGALSEKLPDDVFARVTAGRIYAAYGLREQAMAEIDRALEISPEAHVYINRSQVREWSDYDGRLADLSEALRLDPDDMQALSSKGRVLTERGDHAEALEVYEQVIEVEGPTPDLLTRRGLVLLRLGRADEAEADFALARAAATEAESLNSICYLKAMAGLALELALEECDASLSLAPDDPATLDSRATVLLQLGRLEEAVKAFDRVLETRPRMSVSLFGRAVAQSRLGNLAAAAADEEAALARDPNIGEHFARAGLVIEREPTP